MLNIGLFGGTFDPIHLGHTTILNCFIEKCNLDICYIIPAKCSPFKQNKANKYSDEERIKLIEKETINIHKAKLSLYEINNSEISYSINTIRHFKQTFPNDSLYLLIGFDAATTFHKWKEFEKILSQTTVVIANRPEETTPNDALQIQTNFANHNVIWLNNQIINVTSTMLRKQSIKK